MAGVALLAGISAGRAVAVEAPASCPNAAVRGGLSASLADCRAYEQVSPAEKGGYNAVGWSGLGQAQAASDGERVFYEGNASFPEADGSNARFGGHLSVRTGEGWRTVELTPGSEEVGPTSEYFAEYPVFSDALTQAVVKVPLALTANANPRAWSLYVRDLSSAAPWEADAPEYSWINALHLAAPAGERCRGIPGEPSCGDSVEFAGASRGLTHALFESSTHLLKESPAAGVEELYETEPGLTAPRIVGVLPDGAIAPGGATGGSGTVTGYIGAPLYKADRRAEHAISADGERVVFQAKADGGTAEEAGQTGLTEVYDRIGGAATVELSAPAAAAKPANGKAEPAEFWAAATDGSRVFFTSSAELTSESNTGAANEGSDLYEATLEERTSQPPKVALRALSVDTADPAGARVLGVVGVSEDGEYVYFVAEAQLVAGKGTEGEPNLYVEHDGGQPIFIATLEPSSGEGASKLDELGDALDWTPYSLLQRAYVTPDGAHLAFTSLRKPPTLAFPSGYDNTDPKTGKPDSEVYEYAAPSAVEETEGKTGKLVCVSCDPTGAPPSGEAAIAGTGASKGTPITPTTASTPFHRVRAVSDSGARVFFSAPPFSSEAAADSAETAALKIFEYEQDHEGSCRSDAGCVFRLSAADNPTPDLFLDASEEGKDVFFATYSQLAASDVDSLIDVYDAREYGGFKSPNSTTECESNCRGTTESPAPPQLVTSLTGPSGNLLAQTKPARKRAKTEARRRHRLRACRRNARHHKRRRRSLLRKCERRFGSRAHKAVAHSRQGRHGRRRR